ncbi:MAG: hypothetical protein LBR58_05815 [Propionibacteriaceae bacterium]|jgi:hypothetical protein|nr:hypothetical protein [Propionibacteriaceae bacterium]
MAPDFAWNSEDLAAFATTISGFATSAGAASAYTSYVSDAGSSTGSLFQQFAGIAASVGGKIQAFDDRVATYLSTAGTELANLRNYYVQADASTADALDAAVSDSTYYPNLPGGHEAGHYDNSMPNYNPYHTRPTHSYSGDPASALTTPSASEPIPNLVDLIIDCAAGFVSPSTYVLGAMEVLGIPNPLDWVYEKLAGDWNKAAVGGDALGHLADYHERLGVQLSNAKASVLGSWQGNSAAAMNSNFNRAIDTIDDMPAPLIDLKAQFENVATGMYQHAQAVASQMVALLDLLIALGITLAAAASTSWTGWGLLAGLIAAAAEIAACTTVISGILTLYELMEASINDMRAAAAADSMSFDGITLPQLGRIPTYDSPFV